MRLLACLSLATLASVLGSNPAMAAGSPAPETGSGLPALDLSAERSAHADECDTLFKSVVTLPWTPGQYTYGVAAGDFNGDRIIDLATTNGRDSVHVRFGMGDGTFGSSRGYPVPSYPGAIVTADFNGDGILDLATSTGGSVSVLLGQGTPVQPQGTFGAPIVSHAGPNSSVLTTGDFNHDGVVDLAVDYNTSYPVAGGVAILIGQGDGTFAAPVQYPLEYTYTSSIATGDFDADGITDLAVALPRSGRVAILRGQGSGGVGDGTFAAPAYFPAGQYPRSTSVGDFNSDGILDLAVAMNTRGSAGMEVLLGQGSGRRGDGTFGPPTTYLDGTPDSPANVGSTVAAGDFDGDGVTDLAIATVFPGGITLMHGVRGGGRDARFEPLGWAGLFGPMAIAVADFDGDGLPDIAAANYGGTLSVLLNHDRSGGPVHRAPGWAPDGLALCTALGDQVAPAAISDGAGGVIVTWTDGRLGAGTLYAQRIKATGVPAWAADGVAVCGESGSRGSGTPAADGKGGAWIGWTSSGVHVQHITSAGEPDLAPCPGFQVSSKYGAYDLQLAADGSGGIYAAYVVSDYQGYDETAYYLYCQHLTASGTPAPGWPADEGLLIARAYHSDLIFNDWFASVRISADHAGGVMVAWDKGWDDEECECEGQYSSIARIGMTGGEVYRLPRFGVEAGVASAADGSQILVTRERPDSLSDEGSRIVAERVGPDGIVGPKALLCSATGARHLTAVIPSMDGAASVVWADSRSGGSDIYAGRVTAGGQLATGWPANGAAVCVASGDQVQPTGLALADGRLLTSWVDGRGASNDIYGMLMRADGTPEQGWPADGMPICTASGAQTNPVIVQGDGSTAIVVWQDHRCGNWDIYAQKVQLDLKVAKNDAASGGGTAPRFSLGGAWPNPAHGKFAVAFTLPDVGSARLEVLDVAGRKVLERELRGMGAGQHVVSLGEDGTLAPGVYAIRVRAGGQVLSKMVVLTR